MGSRVYFEIIWNMVIYFLYKLVLPFLPFFRFDFGIDPMFYDLIIKLHANENLVVYLTF